MNRGILFVYSGPSGVGKHTVKSLFFNDPELNLVYSVSMTTRSMRQGETNGREYFFVSREEFERARLAGELLESAEFVGNFYGTPRGFVDKLLDQGKNVLLEIEVVGALQVMAAVPECVSIFLVPPSIEELERRLRGRKTEDDATVAKRIAKASGEMKQRSLYDHVVVNDEPARAAAEIKAIIAGHVRAGK